MEITQNLIENFQAGDRDAFNTLYKELSSFIFNVIFRMVKTKEIAEELTHDVFIKLYDNRTTFNHSVKFETWSYRIAMNHTLNWLKRGQSLRSKLNQIVFKKYESDSFTNIEINKTEVELTLLKMKPDFRICLILREIEEKTYEEISEILNISIGTVRSRLNRSKKMFKAIFERTCKNES